MNEDNETFNTFKEILAKNPNATVLTQLYQIDQTMFSPLIISLIVELGSKSRYNIKTLGDFTILCKLPIFAAYIDAANDSQQKLYAEQQFSVYFKSIVPDTSTVSWSVIKNRILGMLRAQFTIPQTDGGYNIANASVSINTTYQPKTNTTYDNVIDVVGLLRNQFKNATCNKPEQIFKQKTFPMDVRVQEAILSTVINEVVALQEVMKNVSESLCIKQLPFLNLGKL